MQIAQTQPQTLMMQQSVAQGAHLAVLNKHPELSQDRQPAKPAASPRASSHPDNSIDILV